MSLTQRSVQQTTKHRLVIVGGGIGGLELVSQLMPRLNHHQIDVTLIDQHVAHVWKPTLYKTALGQSDAEDIQYYTHAKQHGYRFRMGTVCGIDRANKQVLLDALTLNGHKLSNIRRIAYDTLVLAVGTDCNAYATDGAMQYCHFLDSRRHAHRLHRALLNLYADAQPRSPIYLTILGSSTRGVELAAALGHLTRTIYNKKTSQSKNRKTIIQLIEPQSRILPYMPSAISRQAHKSLQAQDVRIHLNQSIQSVDTHEITTTNGMHYPSDLHIWTMEKPANQLLNHLNLSLDDNQYICVNRYLQSADSSIFALGQCAHLVDDTFEQAQLDMPITAIQMVSQQARYLAQNLPRYLNSQPMLPFQLEPPTDLEQLAQVATIQFNRSMNVNGIVAPDLYQQLYNQHQHVIKMGH